MSLYTTHWTRRYKLQRRADLSKIQRSIPSDLGVIPPGKAFTVCDYDPVKNTATIIVDGCSYLVNQDVLRMSVV